MERLAHRSILPSRTRVLHTDQRTKGHLQLWPWSRPLAIFLWELGQVHQPPSLWLWTVCMIHLLISLIFFWRILSSLSGGEGFACRFH